MKKLILIAGLAGIIVTGAFAQGNPSSTATVSVTVGTYCNISPVGAGSLGAFTFNITNGGYSGNYPSSGPLGFTATSNVPFNLSSGVTFVASNNVYAATTTITGGLLTNAPATTSIGVNYMVDMAIQGSNAGYKPDSTTGTVTVNIAPFI